METRKPICALIALVASASAGNAAAEFFTPNQVHEITLTLSKAEWESMTPSRGQGMGPMALDYPEIKADVVIDGKPYTVGLRFKGNSSYMMSSQGSKRPFKIDLNQYVKGQSHEGQSKLNLNNNVSDQSQIRETVAYEVFRQLGVPCSRTTLAKVTLLQDGETKVLGLYTLAEQVDSHFLKNRFGTGDGLLLKPENARGGLPALGNDWKRYEQIYDPKGKPTDAEKQRFMAFTKLVNEADAATFAKEVSDYLDLDEFARFLAGNVVTTNGDSILSMGHNFYIWQSPKTGKYLFLPWDLNMAFGGFPMMGGDPVKLSVKKPYSGQNRLLERFLALPEGRAAYEKACREAAKIMIGLASFHDTAATAAKPIAALDPKDAGGFPGGGPGGFGGPGGGLGGRGGGGFGGPGGGFPGGGPNGQGGPGGGQGGRRGGGGFGGPGGPMGRSVDLKTFLVQRATSVIAQLDGTEQGVEPTGGMGGPGGPGGFGGPGGGFGGGFPGGDMSAQIGGDFLRLTGAGESPTLAAFGEAWKKNATAWDKNHDGKLTRTELLAGVRAVFTDGVGPGQFLGRQLWDALDVEQSIPISTFSATLARWGATWDKDKNKTLTAAEVGGGVMATLPMPNFGGGQGGFPGGFPGGGQ